MSDGKKRVVILGAGSAGLGAALRLKKAAGRAPGLEVTLVDRNNYHFVLPIVYQVVTGSVAPTNISFPVRILLRRRGVAGPVRFMQSHVQAIDVQARTVTTDDGELQWDYLVVALGATTNFFGMEDVQRNALTFRSLKDGIIIRNRVLDNYEAALWETNEQRQRELLTFVIVGGGPTGVELAASIQDLVGKVLTKDYPGVASLARVMLIESQDRILPGLDPRAAELATRGLRSRGVDVLLGTRISKAWEGGVETADGRTVPSNAVIWSAGVKPAEAVESLPFEKAKDGRILVDQHMEVPNSPGVYVLGDSAYLLQPDGSAPYPATFQIAYRQGPACADNIVRALQGRPQRPFRRKYVGQVIYMSRSTAVAQILGRVFDGYAAGMLRRMLYLWMVVSYLGLSTGLKSKLSAVVNWVFAYFYIRDTARLE